MNTHDRKRVIERIMQICNASIFSVDDVLDVTEEITQLAVHGCMDLKSTLKLINLLKRKGEISEVQMSEGQRQSEVIKWAKSEDSFASLSNDTKERFGKFCYLICARTCTAKCPDKNDNFCETLFAVGYNSCVLETIH